MGNLSTMKQRTTAIFARLKWMELQAGPRPEGGRTAADGVRVSTAVIIRDTEELLFVSQSDRMSGAPT